MQGGQWNNHSICLETLAWEESFPKGFKVAWYETLALQSINTAIIAVCSQQALPPTLPFFPTLANLPASVLLGNTHQHSNRCHLATGCRLQHIRQNKNSVQRENNTQGGSCDRRALTCRHRVVREEAVCVLISHPIVPKPAAGMLSSPIIPCERFLPCPRTPPFPHRTSTWDRPGSSGTETSNSRLQLLYDTHRTSVEITLSICPHSVSTHSEEYFSSSKEHLLP